MVVEMLFAADGSLKSSSLYGATVRNHAKLTYNGVAGRLEGRGPMPPEIGPVAALKENLHLQDRVAQKLRGRRHLRGALDLETIEARPVFAGDELKDLRAETGNRATDIIEDFMIAAKGVTAQFLASKKLPSTAPRGSYTKALGADRRAGRGERHILPQAADAAALERFLVSERAADPGTLPIFHSASSSSWARANTPSSFRVRLPLDTSALPSWTTRTPRRRTGDTLTSLPSGC